MKKPYENISVIDVVCAAVDVYNTQGFIKSGYGRTDYTDPEKPVVINDNKTCIVEKLSSNKSFSDETLKSAISLVETIEGKLMFKKLTGNLSSFEKSVVDALSAEKITNFVISIIASLPHSIQIDKKRQTVEDKIATLKHSSKYFGEKGKRYDINVDVLDVKFIQSSSIYMITTVYAQKDIIKFWWRDQPDLSDIISGKTVKIRGTVNKHEISKYTTAQETMLNRVKLVKIN